MLAIAARTKAAAAAQQAKNPLASVAVPRHGRKPAYQSVGLTHSPATTSLTSLLYSELTCSPIVPSKAVQAKEDDGAQSVARTLDLSEDKMEEGGREGADVAGGVGAFSLDYSAVNKEADRQRVPCSKWPQCTFGDKCKFAHPSEDSLRDCGRSECVLAWGWRWRVFW